MVDGGEGDWAFGLGGDFQRRTTQEERLIIRGKRMMNLVLGKVILQTSSPAKQCHPHYDAHAVITHLGIM